MHAACMPANLPSPQARSRFRVPPSNEEKLATINRRIRLRRLLRCRRHWCTASNTNVNATATTTANATANATANVNGKCCVRV